MLENKDNLISQREIMKQIKSDERKLSLTLFKLTVFFLEID